MATSVSRQLSGGRGRTAFVTCVLLVGPAALSAALASDTAPVPSVVSPAPAPGSSSAPIGIEDRATTAESGQPAPTASAPNPLDGRSSAGIRLIRYGQSRRIYGIR